MNDWTLERLRCATIAPLEGSYEAIPTTDHQKAVYAVNPDVFKFQVISVGDSSGQAFIVPLDESGKGTAELILKALAQYDPDRDSDDQFDTMQTPESKQAVDSLFDRDEDELDLAGSYKDGE